VESPATCNQGSSAAVSSDGSVIAVGASVQETVDWGSTTVYTRASISSPWVDQSSVVGLFTNAANQGSTVALSANGQELLVIGISGSPFAWIFSCPTA